MRVRVGVGGGEDILYSNFMNRLWVFLTVKDCASTASGDGFSQWLIVLISMDFFCSCSNSPGSEPLVALFFHHEITIKTNSSFHF